MYRRQCGLLVDVNSVQCMGVHRKGGTEICRNVSMHSYICKVVILDMSPESDLSVIRDRFLTITWTENTFY